MRRERGGRKEMRRRQGSRTWIGPEQIRSRKVFFGRRRAVFFLGAEFLVFFRKEKEEEEEEGAKK